MALKESTHTTEPATRPRWLWIVVVAVVAGLALAVSAWVMSDDGEPVAAWDAQIELTYTGDSASYVGDREIVAGPAQIVFTNDSDDLGIIVVQRFDSGSAMLAAELEARPEGIDFDTTTAPPGEVELMAELYRDRRIWRLILEPGTYFVEAAHVEGDGPTHVWRAAVIEVVPA